MNRSFQGDFFVYNRLVLTDDNWRESSFESQKFLFFFFCSVFLCSVGFVNTILEFFMGNNIYIFVELLLREKVMTETT